jgi:hypothetical protein
VVSAKSTVAASEDGLTLLRSIASRAAGRSVGAPSMLLVRSVTVVPSSAPMRGPSALRYRTICTLTTLASTVPRNRCLIAT